MIKVLPQLEDVFFIHYQCDYFEVGNKIYSLSIYANGKTIEFFQNTESENIEHYCNKVKELCNKGLIPIHWNQNKTYYGNDHIINRYKELTGKTIVLEYTNCINLGDWLINTYGERYIAHKRLDNLAKLNEFNGITDKESRIFHTNRLFLLVKIYHNALKGTLKTELNNNTAPKTPKDYKDAIWFATGIKLATGEAYELYKKQKNFTVLTKELGFKESDRPYFSATIQNNDSDKNTFVNPDKVRKLHQYLTENNLNFGDVFLRKYNQLEPE